MSQFEARYLEAQQSLRRLTGTNQVLRKQVESATDVIAEVRIAVDNLTHLLTGEDRKEVQRLGRLCQDWQLRAARISTGE